MFHVNARIRGQGEAASINPRTIIRLAVGSFAPARSQSVSLATQSKSTRSGTDKPAAIDSVVSALAIRAAFQLPANNPHSAR
jgi:hypothetical protein